MSPSAVPEVSAAQALAFRLAGHHLDAPVDVATAVAACGIQEFPPGQGAIALAARTGLGAEDALAAFRGEDLVVVNAMRGSPHLVPRRDVEVFTRALVPEDRGRLDGLVGSGPAKELVAAGHAVGDALDLVAAAARDGLAAGPLDRDAFHQALRERLPATLLPWCRGCGSHHVRPGLWRALGPLGVTEMPERAVWTRAAGAPDDGPRGDEARRELVRRFLRAFGPGTHSQLAAWAQTAPQHAKALFDDVSDELRPVRLEGARRLVLRADLDRLLDPPPVRGLRLLHGHDPWVGQPDRATLAPDPAVRKRMFPSVGRPGVVLHDGATVGLWRARKSGPRLDLTVEWTGREVDLGSAPEELAALRGCSAVRLV